MRLERSDEPEHHVRGVNSGRELRGASVRDGLPMRRRRLEYLWLFRPSDGSTATAWILLWRNGSAQRRVGSAAMSAAGSAPSHTRRARQPPHAQTASRHGLKRSPRVSPVSMRCPRFHLRRADMKTVVHVAREQGANGRGAEPRSRARTDTRRRAGVGLDARRGASRGTCTYARHFANGGRDTSKTQPPRW